MQRWQKLSILVVVIIVGLGAGLFWLRPVDNQSSLTKLRVAQTGDFLLYAGLYLAQDTGAFSRHGLDVSITNTGGDDKSVAAVIAGQADIGVGDPTFAAIARERGQDVRVIASIVNGVPFWGVTYDQEVANRYHASGLKGLRVATFPAPSTAYTLQKEMFEKEGLSPSIVEGAFGSLAGILENGQADIALELEPNVSLLQTEKGAIILYSMAERFGDFAITGATVRADFAKKNSASLTRFCGALSDAYSFARTNPDETAQYLEKRFADLPRSVVGQAVARMVKEGVIPDKPVIGVGAWRKAIELRAAVGDIRSPDKAQTALDNSYCGALSQ